MENSALEELFADYSDAASELLAAAENSPRRPKLQEDADAKWLSYVDAGGGREPWHEVGQPWEYSDGFTPMESGSSAGPVAKLRELLGVHMTGPLGRIDDYAIFSFRRQHHLVAADERLENAPPQRVDRHLWSLILAEKGEVPAPVFAMIFAVATNTGKASPLRIRRKRAWKLALDLEEQRTFANQHNLALLATLSYADVDAGKPLSLALTGLSEPRYREDVVFPDSINGQAFRPLVRPDDSGASYEYYAFQSPSTHTQVFMLDHPEHTIVACRGTEIETDLSKMDKAKLEALIADLSTDLDAKRSRWMYDGSVDKNGNAAGIWGLEVHHGFYVGFDSIREQLYAKLDAMHARSPTKPIFVTGHSLGGALATLVACYIRTHRKFWRHPVVLYTYAQPRVGTIAFADHYWTKRSIAGEHFARFRPPPFVYYRIHDLYDIVPMVPNKFLADAIAGLVEYHGGAVAAALKEFTRGVSLAPFSAAVNEVRWTLAEAASRLGSSWLQKQLHAMCPPQLDYRHFGVPVLALQDDSGHPYLVEDPLCEREIEDESIPRIQTVWKPQSSADTQGKQLWDHAASIGTYHVMANYLSHSMHMFEHRFDAYASNGDATPIMSGEPLLGPHEIQLTHRFFHNHSPMLHHHFEDG